MNKPTWRQHYLPAVYLQQLSIDGATSGRRSKVWRMDERINKLVVVEDQCFRRFYNSESNPEKAELVFRHYEDIYGKLAQRFWRQQEAGTPRNYFALVAFMVSLHFRNPSYDNRTKNERVAVYVDLEGEFLHQSLGVVVDPVTPSQEHLELFTNAWRVCLMTVDSGGLLSSDNPSQIYHVDGLPRLITLPVTPKCCAVAFDKRSFPLVRSQLLTQQDVGRLNRIQIGSRMQAIFSAVPLTREEELEIRDYWRRQNRPSGFVDDEEWRPNYRRLEPFDFLANCVQSTL